METGPMPSIQHLPSPTTLPRPRAPPWDPRPPWNVGESHRSRRPGSWRLELLLHTHFHYLDSCFRMCLLRIVFNSHTSLFIKIPSSCQRFAEYRRKTISITSCNPTLPLSHCFWEYPSLLPGQSSACIFGKLEFLIYC